MQTLRPSSESPFLSNIIHPDIIPILLFHAVLNLIGTALRKCLRNLLVHSLTVIRMYAVNNHAINGTVKFIIGIAQIGQKEVIDIVERKAWLQISAYHAAGNTLSKNVQRPKPS